MGLFDNYFNQIKENEEPESKKIIPVYNTIEYKISTLVDMIDNVDSISDEELKNVIIRQNKMLLNYDPFLSNQDTRRSALKLFTADAMPAFSCPEGFRCEFSLNKKTHRGILTEEGNDKYRIDFSDSYKPFLAEITGDRLTLKNEKGNISIVFKVRQDASED